MLQYETMTTDVLILGGGAAGIRAALAASEGGTRIVIVSRGDIANSGSTFSKISRGWGIQALVGSERSEDKLEVFYDDVIKVGRGRCDPVLVRILVEESGARVEDLISYGLQFKKDQYGNYFRGKGCFSEYERAFITANFANMKKTFISILKRIRVKVLKGNTLDLIVDDGICWGAWILSESGKIIKLNAKSTIITTGGGAGVYEDHLVSDDDVGDGYALAHRAGAELINMEFIQFMLGLKNNGYRNFLPVSALKKSGVLCDITGRDLMDAHFPDERDKCEAIDDRQKHGPFSCSDSSSMIDLAVAQSRAKGIDVYWNENGAENEERNKVVNIAHAFNGGVKINEKAETKIAGLYAAGEVSAGPHGADRIGGCMLAATQVFGRRAGLFAMRRVKSLGRCSFPEISSHNCLDRCEIDKENSDSHDVLAVATEVRQSMRKFVGVMRYELGLKRCKKILQDCKNRLNELKTTSQFNTEKYFQVRNMILTSLLIADSALMRRESRGGHYRIDFSPPSMIQTSTIKPYAFEQPTPALCD